MTGMSAFKNITARLRELRSEWIGDGEHAPDRPPPASDASVPRPTEAGLSDWPSPDARTVRNEPHVHIDFAEHGEPDDTAAPPVGTAVTNAPVAVGGAVLLASLPPTLRQNLSDTVDHCGRLLAEADHHDTQVVRDSRAKEKTAAQRREVEQWTHFVWGALVAQHAALLDHPTAAPHPGFPRTSGPRALTGDLIEHARAHHVRQAERGRAAPWTLDPAAYALWDEQTD